MGCADWRCLDSPCFLTPSASSRPPPRLSLLQYQSFHKHDLLLLPNCSTTTGSRRAACLR